MMSPMRSASVELVEILIDRRDGIAGRRAEPGGEENEVRARTRLCGHALDVVARRAKQSEPRASWRTRENREHRGPVRRRPCAPRRQT